MEGGFGSRIQSEERIEIDLGEGVTLLFLNAAGENDCLVGFEGTPWHAHETIIFADYHGHNIEVDYLNLITGLKDGVILICESWIKGQLADRWLIHRDYNDELRYLDKTEEIRIYPVGSL